MPKTASARKRNRYIAHACDRCKASKVRCNGAVPCAYCFARDPHGCHYEAARFPVHSRGNDDTILASIATQLQQQNDKLDYLIQRVAVLDNARKDRVHQPFSAKSRAFSPPKQPLPLFQSPTNSFFCIGVLDTTLEALELEDHGAPIQPDYHESPTFPSFSILEGEIIHGEPSETVSIQSEDIGASSLMGTVHSLDGLDGGHIIRLINVYQDMMGFMYPILDISHLLQEAEKFNEWPGADPGHPAIDGNDINILKMVVAIAMTAEPEEYSDLASSFFQSLRENVEAMVWSAQLDLKGLTLLVLVSLFHFSRSTWRLAWRMISSLSRIILELGLNRQIVLDRSFPDPADRTRAVNTIWTIFVLDQHLSYSLGLSIAMRDLHLDPGFPDPVDAPYLKAMIEYSGIGAPACDLLLGENCKWQERFAFFQYRLQQWEQRIDGDFQLAGQDERTDQANRMLRTILHLRANHLRILIAKPFLCARLRPVAPIDIWSTSVDVAADTISFLVNLESSTQTYRFQQTQFNCFLISALGIILLAVTKDISKQNLPSSNGKPIIVPPATAVKARESAMAAMDLLHSQADSSHHSQRLSEFVRNLAYRLNLLGWLLPKNLLDPASTEPPVTSITLAGNAEMHQITLGDSNWYKNIRDLGLDGPFSASTSLDQDLGMFFDNSFFATSDI